MEGEVRKQASRVYLIQVEALFALFVFRLHPLYICIMNK